MGRSRSSVWLCASVTVEKKKATVLAIIWHKYGVSHQLLASVEDKDNLLTPPHTSHPTLVTLLVLNHGFVSCQTFRSCDSFNDGKGCFCVST